MPQTHCEDSQPYLFQGQKSQQDGMWCTNYKCQNAEPKEAGTMRREEESKGYQIRLLPVTKAYNRTDCQLWKRYQGKVCHPKPSLSLLPRLLSTHSWTFLSKDVGVLSHFINNCFIFCWYQGPNNSNISHGWWNELLNSDFGDYFANNPCPDSR